MKRYVASMVIYPPEPPKFPEERKLIVYYRTSEESAVDECFTLKYEHHSWVSDSPIKLGTRCICGQEKAIEDK